MDSNDQDTIWGQDGLLKDTVDKLLLFLQESYLIWIARHIGKVDDIVDIVTASCSLEMTLPGVKVTIFLERLVVRDTTFHALLKVGNGRNGSRWYGTTSTRSTRTS
jgi:hypothetical protein